jgi:hypothetical protein
MTQTHIQTLATVAVAALLVLAAAPAGVAAQADTADDGLFDGIDGPGGLVDAVTSSFSAANDAIGATVRSLAYGATGPDRTPQEQAQALADVYNANSDSIETYANTRFNGDASDWNVVKITVRQTDTDEPASVRYLVANVTSDGNFTDSKMVETTSRDVDAELVLEDAAAANADTELEHFVDAYVAEERDLDTALRSRLAPYSGDIDLPDGVMG